MAEHSALSDERYQSKYAILQDLFSGAQSPKATADRLASIAFDNGPETGVILTWEAIVLAAREMPQHQEKLVSVLEQMAKLPDEMNGDEVHKINDQVVWSDLPDLGMEFNEIWNSYEIPAEPGDHRTSALQQFVNANTFMARLLRIEPLLLPDLTLIAIFAMRTALETPLQQYSDVFPLEATLPAAVTLITTAGPQIYRWDREYEHGPLIGSPGRGGPLWQGKHGFCIERWNLWKKQFGELASSSSPELSAELKALAREAETRMSEIEAEQ